ncbi:MAG: acyltransferase family protein [Salinivirgaceae bacterium]|jgi:peptidoglycan/LPS O-acetylase OafA/YrhL|nr:acyltransferase [Bacteroidales bacterium]
MKVYSLSKNDTTLIKGLAIFGIVFHNFFHHLSPFTGENEFEFNPSYVYNLFNTLKDYTGEIINILFSYFGHFGVQLFIFISGYGLAVSFINRDRSWLTFMIERLKKLYPLLIIGTLVLFLTTLVVYNKFLSIETWRAIGYKFLFIHTITPYECLNVSGPWWFFGLIFQLYLLFPLLNYLIKKFNIKGFLIICLLSYIWIYISQYEFGIYRQHLYLLANSPGHVAEFCLGIWFAHNKNREISPVFLVLAIIVFSLGNFFQSFFPLTFLSVCLIFIFCYPKIKQLAGKKPRLLQTFFLFLGKLSMILFVINAVIRDPIISTYGKNNLGAVGHLVLAILFFVFIIILAIALKPVHSGIGYLFNKIPSPEKSAFFKPVERIVQTMLVLLSIYIVIYLIPKNKQQITSSHITPGNIITYEDTYKNLAIHTFTNNPHGITVKISFDYKHNEGEIPSVVYDISNALWKNFHLSQVKENEFTHHEFTHTYYKPFFLRINNKEVKAFFWPRNKTSGEYKNVNVSFVTTN